MQPFLMAKCCEFNLRLLFTLTARPGLKDASGIMCLNQAILKVLKYELAKTHKSPFKGDISVLDALLARLPMLRELSLLHMEALTRFRRSHPELDEEFPPLHRELFSIPEV